jgi:hypothetical protein
MQIPVSCKQRMLSQEATALLALCDTLPSLPHAAVVVETKNKPIRCSHEAKRLLRRILVRGLLLLHIRPLSSKLFLPKERKKSLLNVCKQSQIRNLTPAGRKTEQEGFQFSLQFVMSFSRQILHDFNMF